MKTSEATYFKSAKYDNHGTKNMFMQVLKKRMDEYFFENNLSKFANAEFVVKLVLILLVFGVCYALMISNWFSPWITLLLGTICGLCTVMMVMNIGHDAVHNALSPNKRINNLMAFSFELAGMSHYMWKINHNIIHHPFPNISPIDSEINQAMPFIRLSPFFKKSPIHRYQHYYAPFIYLFFTINLTLIRDFQDIGIIPKTNNQKLIRRFSFSQYLKLVLSKLFYITYALIIPIAVLNIVWWKIILGFIFVHAIMSLFELSIQFPLHANDRATVLPINDQGVIQRRWEEQVLDNTTDYMSENKLVNFITGGINTHTVHHFFPGICHVHYIPLTKILSKTAKEFGLPYHRLPWSVGMASHMRRLKQLAIAP